MYVSSWCSTCFCVVLCIGFCTGHFVMVPLNLTYLHCLQHSFFEPPQFILLTACPKWRIDRLGLSGYSFVFNAA